MMVAPMFSMNRHGTRNKRFVRGEHRLFQAQVYPLARRATCRLPKTDAATYGISVTANRKRGPSSVRQGHLLTIAHKGGFRSLGGARTECPCTGFAQRGRRQYTILTQIVSHKG